jgi:hypothetical protein
VVLGSVVEMYLFFPRMLKRCRDGSVLAGLSERIGIKIISNRAKFFSLWNAFLD